jgi:periplasmic glucans biosynthesis protein
MTEYPRREFLKVAFAGALAAAGEALFAAKASAESLSAPSPFTSDTVAAIARELAKGAYKPPAAPLPEPFPSLDFDQFAAIKRNPGTAIWEDAHSPFTLEPLHRGFLFKASVELYLVENGEARKLAYDRSLFDFGKLQVPKDLKDLDFSGVRILRGGDGEGRTDAAIFQGATFFRSLAQGQAYGLSARGLAIRAGDAQGEEFPVFRALWIEKPSLATDALVIHALLDSASLTGAYRFTLRAGEATIIDTELTLFARVDVDHLGLAPMAGVYMFGPLDHLKRDDVRAGVHDLDGLQILTGTGEWIWRPFANRTNLQISGFVDKNLRGFGMLQRNRNFDFYQDDRAHWELRPSLWIEPIGDWGEGETMLLEIPSDSETHDNVVALWRPKNGLAAGGSVSFAYRQFWCWSPPAKPNLAIATQSRVGQAGKLVRFIVEFVSDAFADPQKAAEASAAIEAAPGKIVAFKLYPYRERRSIRVEFDLDPASSPFSELRLALKAADTPLSETWLYRWTA